MQVRKTDKGYIIRLLTGEKLIETLTTFCTEQKIYSGIFQAIGAVAHAEIGYYHLTEKSYQWKELDEDLEIVNMTGNVALVEGNPFLHIHTILSDAELHCYGGHLKEAKVGATCEIYLTDFQTDISRIYDETTGLKLLDCQAQ